MLLRSLLKLICAGATCKKQNRPPLPPAARIQAFVKDRTVEWGIWAPGLPSLNPPVEKTREEKENSAGAHPPGGSREYVGGSALPIPPSRRQGRNGLLSLPQVRAPSGLPTSAGRSRTRRQTACPSILVEKVRAAPRAQIAWGAATRALGAPGTRVPGPNPQENSRVVPGQATGQAGGGLARSEFGRGKAARRSPAGLASRLWTGTEARGRPWQSRACTRGPNLEGGRPQRASAQPDWDRPANAGQGSRRKGRAAAPALEPRSVAAKGPGRRAPGLRKPRRRARGAGGRGLGPSCGRKRPGPRRPAPGSACRVQPCFGCPLP